MSPTKTNPVAFKNVYVAVEPAYEKSLSLNKFANTIELFQKASILPEVSIVSLIHPSLFLVPLSWYQKNEDHYASEARSSIEKSCQNRFNYYSIHVLKTQTSSNYFLVEHLSRYLSRARSGLLVVLASSRKGIPYWALGSFAETAVLTCSTSVMVIKPESKFELSEKPRLTVALDANAVYTANNIKWLIDLARSGNARLDLVSVKAKPRRFLNFIRNPIYPKSADTDLKRLKRAIQDAGISSGFFILTEKDSIAQTIVDFADRRKSWGIVTISTQRTLTRKILLGSTARRVLSLTKRPFFAIR